MTKGGRGVGEMLKMAEKGGDGGIDTFILADVNCEQPLMEMYRGKILTTIQWHDKLFFFCFFFLGSNLCYILP